MIETAPPTTPTSLPAPGELRPTQKSERIQALDVARGFALLGIFFVNIQLMSAPLGTLLVPDLSGESTFGKAIHHATRALFESKSYPLFSMLFGMGMALMYDRAKAAGRGFYGRYLRRIAMLFVIGLAHALLLWYGDVLAYYAIIAFVVMWFMPLRAKPLFAIAGVCIAVAALVVFALSTLGVLMVKYAPEMAAQPPPPELIAESPAELATEIQDAAGVPGAFDRLVEAFNSRRWPQPFEDSWMDAERDAFGNGPYAHAVAMRGINWASGLLFWLIFSGTVFHIAGMFFLGAAIMRSRFFAAENIRIVKLTALVGAAVGLPVAAAVAWAFHTSGGQPSMIQAVATGAQMLFGPLVSLLYLSLAALAAYFVAGNLLVRAIAAAGRMALTNYLMQTILVAIIMQHWGLARFDTMDRTQLAGIVFAIYAGQLILSMIWLSVFRMWPFEWAWRTWTYLRLPRLLTPRASAD